MSDALTAANETIASLKATLEQRNNRIADRNRTLSKCQKDIAFLDAERLRLRELAEISMRQERKLKERSAEKDELIERLYHTINEFHADPPAELPRVPTAELSQVLRCSFCGNPKASDERSCGAKACELLAEGR